jgi:hypothetical protein
MATNKVADFLTSSEENDIFSTPYAPQEFSNCE